MATLGDFLRQRYKEHAEATESRGRGEAPRLFLSTGISSWDKNGGLERGIVTLIAGPTGEGKSAIMLHLIRNAAEAGKKCLVLSFEDPPGKTVDRILARSTGEPGHVIGRMDYDPALLVRLKAAAKENVGWADRVQFEPGLSTADAAIKLVQEADADLILVDYAQAFPDGKNETRERMLNRVGWELAKVAGGESRPAVVLFSQVRRDVAERGKSVFDRTGKVDGYRPGPGVSDIGWAESLGQSAKCVIYLFRPGRWGRSHGLAVKDDTMELVFAKVSFGVEGVLSVHWDGPSASIRDRAA